MDGYEMDGGTNQMSDGFGDMSISGGMGEPDDVDLLEHRNPFMLPSDEDEAVFRMTDRFEGGVPNTSSRCVALLR